MRGYRIAGRFVRLQEKTQLADGAWVGVALVGAALSQVFEALSRVSQVGAKFLEHTLAAGEIADQGAANALWEFLLDLEGIHCRPNLAHARADHFGRLGEIACHTDVLFQLSACAATVGDDAFTPAAGARDDVLLHALTLRKAGALVE